MGLVSPVRPVEYKGDGTKTQFTFPFPYDDKKDIVVELYSSNTWISQSEGGSYRFLNDHTIEFNFAPKDLIKISRKTYSRRLIANKFKTSRPECTVVNLDCRGEFDGTDGTLTDDRDDPLRPFKIGDTITYTSPCDEGANIYWYATPREGLSGSATLIRTDTLRGRNDEDKTSSLTLVESHIDKRISVKVRCIGCGPPDGLCCEWTVDTDNDVLKSDVCGLNAVIGSGDSKVLHDIRKGYGVIRLSMNSPDIGRNFTVEFPDTTSYVYTVGGGSTPSAEKIIPKPDDSNYVIITVPNASGKGWQYSLRCTEAVDTSQYKYVRWRGSYKKHHGPYQYGGAWGGAVQKVPESTTDPAKDPKTSPWHLYNSGSKTDGFATINGPGICVFNAMSVAVALYGPYYFGNQPWNGTSTYQPVPWRSSYTVSGFHNGLGICFGALSINGEGRPDGFGHATHFSRTNDSYYTVAGYWEFSNDTSPSNKVVEAKWDGYRGDAFRTGSWTTGNYYTVDDSKMPNLSDIF